MTYISLILSIGLAYALGIAADIIVRHRKVLWRDRRRRLILPMVSFTAGIVTLVVVATYAADG